jgi:hypothetical protein
VERNQLLFLLDSVQEEAIRDEAAASLSETRAAGTRSCCTRASGRNRDFEGRGGGLLAALTGLFIVANPASGYTFSTVSENQLQAMLMTNSFFVPSIIRLPAERGAALNSHPRARR